MDVNYEHRLTDVENRSKANQHRIEEVERRQDNLDDLIGSVRVLADREERVETDVKEIKEDVKTLTNKPAKRWDNAINSIIMTIIAAVVGFFLAKFGL